MRKQEIIEYNLVNFDRLIAANYPKATFISDWSLEEPEAGYLLSKDYDEHRYVGILYLSDGSMYQFGFTNRNRLRHMIKRVQSVYNNVVARFIAEVKHE